MYLLFLDISTGEILVIFIAFLLFFGPSSIPSLAQKLGRFLYEIRNIRSDVEQKIWQEGQNIKHYVTHKRQENQVDKEESTDYSPEIVKKYKKNR